MSCVLGFGDYRGGVIGSSTAVARSYVLLPFGNNAGAAFGTNAVAADVMSGGFGEDFAADGAGLRRGAGCCRTGSVSGGFYENFAAFGAGLRLGAGCRRTGSMFMTAGGKRRSEHYGYK